MKKILIGTFLIGISIIMGAHAQMIVPDSQNYILNENDQQVLNTDNIQDPLRDGAYTIIQSEGGESTVEGIFGGDDKIGSHLNAQHKTLNIVKTAINYALGMISLVALLYLIYNGILMVTAAGEDSQYKKGSQGIKYAVIALIGVGLSRLIVSVIFWLITLVVG